MLKALYEAIRNDAAPEILNIDGRDYTDKKIYPVHMPAPEPLVVSTLSGLCDYLNTNLDKLDITSLICQVKKPGFVAVHSALMGKFQDRRCYISASAPDFQLPIGQWKPAEEFNIALQSCFVEDGDRDTVLKYVSDVVAIAEHAQADNGISQAVTVRAGITSKAAKALPNPVTLRPYRTFVEVQQPASKFIFRIRHKDGGFEYLLAEADGGAWKREAMQYIKEYLTAGVSGLTVIA